MPVHKKLTGRLVANQEIAKSFHSQDVNSKLILLENYLVMSTIFMSVSTAMAPSGKAIIGITLASISAIFGILTILVAAFRPWIFSWIDHKLGHEYGVTIQAYDSIWYQVLQGCAMLLSSVVVSIGAIEASKASDKQAC